MKNERIIDSWNKAQPDLATRERMLAYILAKETTPTDRKINKLRQMRSFPRQLMPLAACLILAVTIGIPLARSSSSDFDLALSQGNVKVRYVENLQRAVKSEDLLVWRTEEELLHRYDTSIFMATVQEIRNIRIDFNGATEYLAIAKLEIVKSYRGDAAVGSTVSLLLPCPIVADVWVEDTDVVSALREGMTGIFMPMRYDEDSCREENGASIHWLDIADYGLLDGMRYAFLETDGGLVFARDAYPPIATATSLGEVEAYIVSMLK